MCNFCFEQILSWENLQKSLSDPDLNKLGHHHLITSKLTIFGDLEDGTLKKSRNLIFYFDF